MKHTVLVASRHPAEARAVVGALVARFAARAVTRPEALARLAEDALALVLDANFTERRGIDALTDVLSRAQLPVLMVTPPEDPRCAVEALRCGAGAYLVKSGEYLDLVPSVLDEMLMRAGREEDLKRTIVGLRRRIAEAERGRITEHGAAGSFPAQVLAEAGRRLAGGESTLAAYPRVAARFREMAARAEVSVGEVAQLLSQDAAISAKLLRLANSAAYGAHEVATVLQAIERLGIDAVGRMVEVVSNQSLYLSGKRAWRPLLDELWTRNLACAFACQGLAREAGVASPGALFSVGLLHDVGKLLLVQVMADLDPEGAQIASPEDARAIRELLEREHAHPGAELLKLWCFGGIYRDAALHHEDPGRAPALTKELLVVHAAYRLAAGESPERIEAGPAARFLGLDATALAAARRRCDEAVERCRAALG
jgi:HD-like signal output (HDOD) protein/AmiR/NasT family two-component response regulator